VTISSTKYVQAFRQREVDGRIKFSVELLEDELTVMLTEAGVLNRNRADDKAAIKEAMAKFMVQQLIKSGLLELNGVDDSKAIARASTRLMQLIVLEIQESLE
jgi:hypothetical protein